jgi:hypothetical protein
LRTFSSAKGNDYWPLTGADDGAFYTAYQRADRFAPARVLKDRTRSGVAYGLFAKSDLRGEPVWSGEIAQRRAILANAGNCYPWDVSYNGGRGSILLPD